MPLYTYGDDLGLLSGIWMESYIRMGKIAPSSSLTLIDTWGPLVNLPRSLPPFLCLPHLNQTHALNACEILPAQPASAHEGADASPPSQQAAEASNNVRHWSYCAAAAG